MDYENTVKIHKDEILDISEKIVENTPLSDRDYDVINESLALLERHL